MNVPLEDIRNLGILRMLWPGSSIDLYSPEVWIVGTFFQDIRVGKKGVASGDVSVVEMEGLLGFITGGKLDPLPGGFGIFAEP